MRALTVLTLFLASLLGFSLVGVGSPAFVQGAFLQGAFVQEALAQDDAAQESGAQGNGKPRRIVIASGPLGGTFYLAAGAICDRLNRTETEQALQCLVLPGGNSDENLAALATGAVDFALVQSDWQYRARLTDAAPEGRFDSLRAVLSLHAWAVTVIAAPGSGITQLSDLKERRISFGPNGVGDDFAGQALMTLTGWQDSDFAEIVELPLQDMPSALCEGRIDAMVLPLVHPDPWLARLLETCDAELIDLASGGIEKVSVAWPFMDRITLPAGLYSGQDQPLETFGLRAGLLTTAQEPAPIVAAVTEAILQDFDSFKQGYPLLLDLTAKRALQAAITAPLHDGIEALVASGRLFP